MAVKIETFLSALIPLGKAATAIPAVIALVEEIARSFTKKTDQATAREAIDALRDENRDGHAELQRLLAEAAKEK